MGKTTKKICPVTGSDEITITYHDPDELVITQRKQPDGKYERTSKPRKEVRNALLPEVACPNLKHPALANLPESLQSQLWKEGKAWCMKIGKACPMDQITYDSL